MLGGSIFTCAAQGTPAGAVEPISEPALRPTSAAALVDARLPRYRPEPIAFPREASYVTSAGEISIIGYNDMLGILTAINTLFVGAHPEFRFSLVLKGTRTAPAALAQGRSAFAPMGAEFSDAELTAYESVAGSKPTAIRVAHDSLEPRALSAPLALYVHHDNPIGKLSIDQAARAFTARTSDDQITRWGQLGLTGEWAQRPIHLCGLHAATALGIFMQKHKLGGHPYAVGFSGFPQSAEAVKCVGTDPLALGFAALNRATPEVKILAVSDHPADPSSRGSREDIISGSYPLDRHLYIFVRRSPGRPLDAFVREYLRLVLSYEGQQAIASGTLGYLPLNAEELAEERSKLD
ncbi:phosphate transport system substrate-binding protein [Collimonas sp. OK307]|nr:phosphate transport system substrate-binding protein [Collimonas sp. OK307]